MDTPFQDTQFRLSTGEVELLRRIMSVVNLMKRQAEHDALESAALIRSHHEARSATCESIHQILLKLTGSYVLQGTRSVTIPFENHQVNLLRLALRLANAIELGQKHAGEGMRTGYLALLRRISTLR